MVLEALRPGAEDEVEDGEGEDPVILLSNSMIADVTAKELELLDPLVVQPAGDDHSAEERVERHCRQRVGLPRARS